MAGSAGTRWPGPQHTTTCDAARDGDLPVIEGSLIRLQAGHLPGGRDPKPAWLWSSAIAPAPTISAATGSPSSADSILSTPSFRLFKQPHGWTAPKIRTPQAADR